MHKLFFLHFAQVLFLAIDWSLFACHYCVLIPTLHCKMCLSLLFYLLSGQNLVMYRFVRKVELAFVYQVEIELESLLRRSLHRHLLNSVDSVKATWFWRFIHCLVVYLLFYENSVIHRVHIKKGATKLMAVTSSNLNRFSKYFYCWKEKKISNKTHVLFSTIP